MLLPIFSLGRYWLDFFLIKYIRHSKPETKIQLNIASNWVATGLKYPVQGMADSKNYNTQDSRVVPPPWY